MSFLGFTFNGIHSSVYSIVAKSTNRSLFPAQRKRELDIAGRHGTIDFEDNKYENRIVEVAIKYIGNSYTELRSRARNIAAWLSQNERKQLIFDDETGKYYMARLYNSSALETLFLVGQATLQFECEPFAYSTSETEENVSITTSGQSFAVTSSGTIETPQVITITNTSGGTITGFTLTKREEY